MEQQPWEPVSRLVLVWARLVPVWAVPSRWEERTERLSQAMMLGRRRLVVFWQLPALASMPVQMVEALLCQFAWRLAALREHRALLAGSSSAWEPCTQGPASPEASSVAAALGMASRAHSLVASRIRA